MKTITLPLLLLALAGTPAVAQVTVNPAVLDPPAKPAPKPAPVRPVVAKPQRTTAKPAGPQQAAPRAAPDLPQGPPAPAVLVAGQPAASPMPASATVDVPPKPPEGANLPAGAKPAVVAGTGDAPVVPAAPPAPPVLPPPLAVTTRSAAPAGTVAIAADAPGAIAAVPGGLRVTFGAGRSDMTQATADAIRGLARSSGKTQAFNVTALAAGGGDDLSAPRRLSLARGLAIRALLINEGVASTRIYVRALGSNAEAIGTAPADRTDIVVGSNPPARPAP